MTVWWWMCGEILGHWLIVPPWPRLGCWQRNGGGLFSHLASVRAFLFSRILFTFYQNIHGCWNYFPYLNNKRKYKSQFYGGLPNIQRNVAIVGLSPCKNKDDLQQNVKILSTRLNHNLCWDNTNQFRNFSLAIQIVLFEYTFHFPSKNVNSLWITGKWSVIVHYMCDGYAWLTMIRRHNTKRVTDNQELQLFSHNYFEQE